MTHSLESDLVDPAVKLLGTAIGMILEDHVHAALTIGTTIGDREEEAAHLERAGRDIAALAKALGVLLRRYNSVASRNVGRPEGS